MPRRAWDGTLIVDINRPATAWNPPRSVSLRVPLHYPLGRVIEVIATSRGDAFGPPEQTPRNSKKTRPRDAEPAKREVARKTAEKCDGPVQGQRADAFGVSGISRRPSVSDSRYVALSVLMQGRCGQVGGDLLVKNEKPRCRGSTWCRARTIRQHARVHSMTGARQQDRGRSMIMSPWLAHGCRKLYQMEARISAVARLARGHSPGPHGQKNAAT